MDLQQLTAQTSLIAKEAGAFLRQQLGRVQSDQIEEKALNSLVSYADREAEKLLVEKLGALLPDSVFLTEEETVEQEKGTYRWIIDPLDGTTNFLHQLPIFSVSIALQKNEETILGIVYEVNRDECFSAWKDGGAWLNDQPINVSKAQELAKSMLATGFPYSDFEYLRSQLRALEYFMQNTRGIRRFGSAAVDLAYVACGRFDAFYESTLNAWDVAAGAFIVQEAGGVVTDFRGGDDFLFGREMIASNAGVSKAMLDVVKRAMKEGK